MPEQPPEEADEVRYDVERARALLLDGVLDGEQVEDRLTDEQRTAVQSDDRRLLIIAGAGSGKTEVMARRIAWLVAVDGVPKNQIAAFTFMEKAAEEMTFRVRKYLQLVTPEGEDPTLGGMYVGTIHAFCLKHLREMRPEEYHNYDILDDAARVTLVQKAFDWILGLRGLQAAMDARYFQTIETFLQTYDLLNEYALLEVGLPDGPAPLKPGDEPEWCKAAETLGELGETDPARAFSRSAARYYAYLKCRRFLDFSTSQIEFVRLLRDEPDLLRELRDRYTHVVVDEVQDINPVQKTLIDLLVGDGNNLTAVGDHRQAIYAWRGGRVEIMGRLYEELHADEDGGVYDLPSNFRSTGRIVDLSNRWAGTINPVRGMESPDMTPGNDRREDRHPTHVASTRFDDRGAEAAWIAETVRRLVPEEDRGAFHDTRDGERGIVYSDIAILIRSSTDARAYMETLENHGIPAVFRKGPDLFSQPEVLVFVGALANLAGIEEFYGVRPQSLPGRIGTVLGCDPEPEPVIRAAAHRLRGIGLELPEGAEDRLVLATRLLQAKIADGVIEDPGQIDRLENPELREWLRRKGDVRRVFPQRLYHYLLREAGVSSWDARGGRYQTAFFHLGQLSSLVKELETPGWTSANDLKFQIVTLCSWGAENARMDEAPLLTQPDAVTISTIHSAKGLEFPVVFLADVAARRFPSSMARREPTLPLDGPVLHALDPGHLADNDNYDDERRLMYVGLTRAERYLFVTASGNQQSRFFRELNERRLPAAGGTPNADHGSTPADIQIRPSSRDEDVRLATTFSDIRYYLECPHDFYLRKVLGFAPTIDQAFGYGRGVHNILRDIHTNARRWAELADEPEKLEAALEDLVWESGLFYLRYTTGDPLENMRKRAAEIVADYVKIYAEELETLEFEPEREFETLLPEEDVLITGAIDLIRLDDPPRVTIIDYKSGDADGDTASKLDEAQMELQIRLYGLAAKQELEYEPDTGRVRYLGEDDERKRELKVEMSEAGLEEAQEVIRTTAASIRDRRFDRGPREPDPGEDPRCADCDFLGFCGLEPAVEYRNGGDGT